MRCNRCRVGLPVFEGRLYRDDKIHNIYICSECGNREEVYQEPRDLKFDIDHPMVAKTMHLTDEWYRRLFGKDD